MQTKDRQVNTSYTHYQKHKKSLPLQVRWIVAILITTIVAFTAVRFHSAGILALIGVFGIISAFSLSPKVKFKLSRIDSNIFRPTLFLLWFVATLFFSVAFLISAFSRSGSMPNDAAELKIAAISTAIFLVWMFLKRLHGKSNAIAVIPLTFATFDLVRLLAHHQKPNIVSFSLWLVYLLAANRNNIARLTSNRREAEKL